MKLTEQLLKSHEERCYERRLAEVNLYPNGDGSALAGRYCQYGDAEWSKLGMI